MRSFPLLYLIIFIGFYFITCLGAYYNLKMLFSYKRFKVNYWAYSSLFIFLFGFLFIYPNQPQNAPNYNFYLFFNAFLFIDLIIKIFLSLFFLFGFLISQKKIVSFIGLIISVGLLLGMVYGLVLGNKKLKTTPIELTFDTLPVDFDNFRIIQISDIHLGSFHKSIVLSKAEQQIKEIDPDLILFTGDLVNNFSYETESWTSLFQRLNSSGTSYSILGNHDYGDYATWKKESDKIANFNEIISSNSRFGFDLLRNENSIIRKGQDSIYIVGVENWGHPPFPQYANLEEACSDIPDNAFKILMTHDPAHWEKINIEKKEFPLTLSGHTHGLQWGIKLAGIPFSFAYFTRKTWGGLYKENNNFLNVNTGLGMVGIPWRIDMPAEITVITLKRAEVY